MAKNHSINQVALEETRIILEQMASLASHGDRMCYYAGCDSDADGLFHQVMFMRDLVNRLGWLADLSLKSLGKRPCVGDAEDWLLPPSFRRQREKAQGERTAVSAD